jgi:hypothetical protein
MIKTQDIENQIETFKKNIKTSANNFYINTGSFWDKKRKYINDIDLKILFKSDDITKNISDIISIIKKINTHTNVIKSKIYIGHHKYYYSTKYNLKDIKILQQKDIISKQDLDSIKHLYEINSPDSVITTKLASILKIKWTINDIYKGYILSNNIRYNLFTSLLQADTNPNLDYTIKIDIIYLYNKTKYIIELGIQTYQSWKNSKQDNNLNIYVGCKLPQIQFLSASYYKAIKRFRSCYGRTIKRKEYHQLSNKNKSYLFDAYNQLTKIISDNEKYISEYHIKKVETKYNNDPDGYAKLNKEFNSHFKELAKKYYDEGIKHNLLF